MYCPGTYLPYSLGTYGTRLMLKVCLSCFSFLLLILFGIRMRHRWTKIDNGTKSSLGSRRSPKRIGANTHSNREMVNIAGFDLATLCVCRNTGADCEPPQQSLLEARLLWYVFSDNSTCKLQRAIFARAVVKGAR
jgi:hypothetical protein